MRETFRGKTEDRTTLLVAWKTVEATKMGASGTGLPKAVDIEDAHSSCCQLRVVVRAPRPIDQHSSFLQVPKMTAQHALEWAKKAFLVPIGGKHFQVTGTKMSVPGDGVTLQEDRIVQIWLG